MRLVRIIVNADDLGASERINAAILKLAKEGKVTSSTLLANGPAFEQAVSAAGEASELSLGVHLNLTEFRPISGDSRLAPLLNDDGSFSGNIREVPLRGDLRAGILEEWCAQVGRVLAAGIQVSHLDSHHHVHTIPGLFGVLKRLQWRFAIRRARITKNMYGLQFVASRSLLLRKWLWNRALRHAYGTRVARGFTSFEEFLSLAEHGRIRHTRIEVMVHPGLPQYENETRLLASEWRSRLPFRTELVNYRAI